MSCLPVHYMGFIFNRAAPWIWIPLLAARLHYNTKIRTERADVRLMGCPRHLTGWLRAVARSGLSRVFLNYLILTLRISMHYYSCPDVLLWSTPGLKHLTLLMILMSTLISMLSFKETFRGCVIVVFLGIVHMMSPLSVKSLVWTSLNLFTYSN